MANKKKKTRLQVISNNTLPYEKMWGDLWDTAGVVHENPPHPGDKVTASAILSLMEVVERRYLNERHQSEVQN